MLVQNLNIQELSKVASKSLEDFEVEEYVLKDQVIFSPGKWKGYHYSPEIVKGMYENTDWTQPDVSDLFLDHYDGTPASPLSDFVRGGTATWVGKIKNVRFREKDNAIIADLHVVDLATVNKLAYPDARFGLSAKLKCDFEEETKKVNGSEYMNTSIVMEPAVKTAYINNSEADERFKELFKQTIKEVLIDMADEKEKEETPEEEEKTEKPEKTEEKEQPTETKETPEKEEPETEEPEEEETEEEDDEELSEEKLSELKKAAQLVLDFVGKIENQEEKTEEEPEETEEEEPEEETPKEETKEKEEVENKADNEEDLKKTVQELTAKIAELEKKKEEKVSDDVEGVTTVENDGLCYKSPVDTEFGDFLKKMTDKK